METDICDRKHSILKTMKKHSVPSTLPLLMLLALGLSLPFAIAAVSHGYIDGDDIQTHMQRVEGMLSALRIGHLSARLHPDTLQGYAYGMGLFYPQLFLWVPVLLRALGLNMILSTNFSLTLLNLATALSAWFCIRRISGSEAGAFAGAVLYLCSSYRLVNLFYRGSAGECLAFLFIPLLVLGLYEILTTPDGGTGYLIAGLSGVVYSHLLSSVFTIAVLGFFILVTLPAWWKKPSARRRLLTGLLFSLLLTASFWLPFLEQYLCVPMKVSTGYDSPFRSALSLKQSLSVLSWWWRDMPEELQDPILWALPAGLLCLLSFKTHQKQCITTLILLLTGAAGLLISSSAFPWARIPALHRFLQFPWRLQFISASFLPLCAGIGIGSFSQTKPRRVTALLCALSACLVTVPVVRQVIDTRIQPSPGYKAIQDGVGAGEYLPAGAEIEDIRKQGKVPRVESSVNILNYHEEGLSAELRYESDTSGSAEFPFLYYRGWMTQSEGNEAEAASMGPHGLVQAELTEENSGKVSIFYQKTPLQWLGDLLSLATLIGMVWCFPVFFASPARLRKRD